MQMMEALDLTNKRVLIREDFNVPMKDGHITHTARIDAALPTIRRALTLGAKVILMSHLGRPKEGEFDPHLTLQPIANYLGTCLGQTVPLFRLGNAIPEGPISLLENVRFLEGEEKNSPILAKQLAELCDIFVMDAFAVAHRAQASTVGVAEFAPIASVGPLLQKELKALELIFQNPAHPVLAIVGGSKVSTKLALLQHVLDKVDMLALGGGIANTFLAAKGLPVGDSLYEEGFIPVAKELMQQAQRAGKTIWLPTDVVVNTGVIKQCEQVQAGDKIFDIGPLSQKSLASLIQSAKTILWNGPIGVFEDSAFEKGTQSIANAIKESKAYSVAGGGDTLAAIEKFNVTDAISYLSTGGGAFLEALEGKKLPGVAVLERKS